MLFCFGRREEERREETYVSHCCEFVCTRYVLLRFGCREETCQRSCNSSTVVSRNRTIPSKRELTVEDLTSCSESPLDLLVPRVHREHHARLCKRPYRRRRALFRAPVTLRMANIISLSALVQTYAVEGSICFSEFFSLSPQGAGAPLL